MTKMLLALAMIVGIQASAQVSDQTSASLAITTIAPSISTVCTAADSGCRPYMGDEAKVIMAAKDDAAAYLASAGELQSAALQRAFDLVRSTDSSLQISDIALAQAILNQK